MDIQSLKLQPRWVCYNEKKAPINPHNGKFADSTDPQTWGTYEEATDAVNRYRDCVGVGIVFTDRSDIAGVDNTIVGIDIDDCFTGDDLHPYAQYLIVHADSYTETSPSGSGIHILGTGRVVKSFKGQLDGLKIEMYGTARYFTFTESPYGDSPDTINDVQHTLDFIQEEREKKQQQEALAKKTTATINASTSRIDSNERERESSTLDRFYQNKVSVAIEMVRSAAQGEKHSKRYDAGRLLGGALQALRDRGYSTMSDDDAIDMLYKENVPESNQRREMKAIEDGLEEGKKSPLIIREYTTRLAREFQQPRAQKSNRMVDEETGEVIDTITTSSGKVYPLTDVGNAQRFADAYGDMFRWIADDSSWVMWTGTHWKRDVADVDMVKYAIQLTIDIYKEAVDETGDIDSKYTKWAKASQSEARIKAMINLSKSHLSIGSDKFDNEKHLLNVGNGIVNLKNGTLIPHDKEYYFTKFVPINYNPRANRQFWNDFLDTVFMNDDELIQYMQKAVGYTLTGMIDEHCLFFCYGGGGNGKSTFVNAMQMITKGTSQGSRDSYHSVAEIEALLDKQQNANQANLHVYNLYKTRLTILQEMPESRKMNESLVKSLTGGDAIVARNLYHGYITFAPTHKMWIVGNYKPKIGGTDDGIWRRFKVVPFLAKIPADKILPQSEIDRQFELSKEGILAWAIEGAIQWFAHGLGKCSAVDKATMMYREEEDSVARFIADNCVMGAGYRVTKDQLYTEWKEWSEDEGDISLSRKTKKWLTRQLKDRFGVGEGGAGKATLIGIGLIDKNGNAPKRGFTQLVPSDSIEISLSN